MATSGKAVGDRTGWCMRGDLLLWWWDGYTITTRRLTRAMVQPYDATTPPF